MDFRQIDAFVNVAKYKSFSKAAEAIYLSQPTISAHIATLENELNLNLFDRNGKEVKLTQAGEIFLEYAINLINIRNTAVLSLSNYDNKIAGRLLIASSTTPTRFLIPAYIKSFSEKYPEVNFDIKESSSKKVMESVLSSSADIGFVGEEICDPRLTYTKVADDSLIIISNISSLPDVLTIDDIFQNKFILREKGSSTRNIFEKTIQNEAYPLNKLNVFCEVDSLEAVLQFVKCGAGISIVSELACNDYLSAGLIRKHTLKNIKIHREIFAVTHNKHTLSPAAKQFLSHVAPKH